MSFHSLIVAAPLSLNTSGLVSYLQGLFGPLFLGIVGIVALFFLFTREIIRFVQFVVLAVAIAVIFYTPSIVQTLAQGIAKALGVLHPHTRDLLGLEVQRAAPVPPKLLIGSTGRQERRQFAGALGGCARAGVQIDLAELEGVGAGFLDREA